LAVIVLFTDFGSNGPYIGQMTAAIYGLNNEAKVITLFANAPSFDPVASAYLLAAYADEFPVETVFLCVVDPGVGTQNRKPIVAHIDGRIFVGPDNGLFDVLASRTISASKQEIVWQPAVLSASFHGRDLFAPVAAQLEQRSCPAEWLSTAEPYKVPGLASDLPAVVYIDDYGNAITGVRAATLSSEARLLVNGVSLVKKHTFGDAAEGEAFWYENSNGLAEIAVNCGSAAARLDLMIGSPIVLEG
jgi:S-adenosylmethionine hydrolase